MTIDHGLCAVTLYFFFEHFGGLRARYFVIFFVNILGACVPVFKFVSYIFVGGLCARM
jgi:hypothetical protein